MRLRPNRNKASSYSLTKEAAGSVPWTVGVRADKARAEPRISSLLECIKYLLLLFSREIVKALFYRDLSLCPKSRHAAVFQTSDSIFSGPECAAGVEAG